MAELDARMGAREFMEWAEFYELDPWGDKRADLRESILCSLVANALRKKGSKRLAPKDFMPEFGKRRRGMALTHEHVSEMMTTMRAFVAHQNAEAG